MTMQVDARTTAYRGHGTVDAADLARAAGMTPSATVEVRSVYR
jgi:hypothetical protein